MSANSAPSRADYARFTAQLFEMANRITRMIDRWLAPPSPRQSPHAPPPPPTGPTPPSEPESAGTEPQTVAPPTAASVTDEGPDLPSLMAAANILKRVAEIVHLAFKLHPPEPAQEPDPFPYSDPKLLNAHLGDEE